MRALAAVAALFSLGFAYAPPSTLSGHGSSDQPRIIKVLIPDRYEAIVGLGENIEPAGLIFVAKYVGPKKGFMQEQYPVFPFFSQLHQFLERIAGVIFDMVRFSRSADNIWPAPTGPSHWLGQIAGKSGSNHFFRNSHLPRFMFEENCWRAPIVHNLAFGFCRTDEFFHQQPLRRSSRPPKQDMVFRDGRVPIQQFWRIFVQPQRLFERRQSIFPF